MGFTSLSSEVAKFSSEWDRIKDLEASRILKFSLLKDMFYSIHALKSRHLAKDEMSLAKTADKIENAIEALAFSGSNLHDRLEDLLKTKEALAPSKHSLKAWTKLISDEVDKNSAWEFWSVSKQASVQDVARLELELRQVLWPDGIVICSETTGIIAAENGWTGSWTCGIRTEAQEVRLRFAGDWKKRNAPC